MGVFHALNFEWRITHWKRATAGFQRKREWESKKKCEAYGVDSTSSSNKESDSKQQQSLEKQNPKQARTSTNKQEPVCWAATSEKCFTKQLSRGLFWYPGEESLTNDLTIGWRVLACILISLLAIGLWVAHFACFFLEDSRASIMLYCPPVSCVGCCHHELWSRSCRVSESPCRFPLSVAISCQERRKVHRCTVVSLTEWSETHFQLTTGHCGSPEAEIETWGAWESIWQQSLVCLVGWLILWTLCTSETLEKVASVQVWAMHPNYNYCSKVWGR